MAPPKKKEVKAKDVKPKKPAKNVIERKSQFDMLKSIATNIKEDMTFEDKNEVKYTPARIISYNRASVFGGYPSGAIYEIHGPNAGGKTALGIEILSAAQQAGHLVGFYDHERAANDKRWISSLGLDLNNCIYRNKSNDPKKIWTLEDAAEELNRTIHNFYEAKQKGDIPPEVLLYLLWDSVAAAVPSAKVKKDAKVGDANYGLTARLMSDWLQTLTALIGDDVAIIFLNQERVNVGAKPWEPKFKSFGGEALQFYAHVRIRVATAGEIKEKVNGEEIITGRKHRFKIEKNKFGYPSQEGYYYTSNGLGESELGFDMARTTIEEALFQGLIFKEGAWYTIPGVEGRIQGERKVRLALLQDEDLHNTIIDTVNSMIANGSAKLNASVDEDEDEDDE
jgi:recombination protein RecA